MVRAIENQWAEEERDAMEELEGRLEKERKGRGGVGVCWEGREGDACAAAAIHGLLCGREGAVGR